MPAMLPRSLRDGHGHPAPLRWHRPQARAGSAHGHPAPQQPAGNALQTPRCSWGGNYPGRTDTERISAPCPSQQRSQAQPVPVPCQPVSLAPGLSPARTRPQALRSWHAAPGRLKKPGCRGGTERREAAKLRMRNGRFYLGKSGVTP